MNVDMSEEMQADAIATAYDKLRNGQICLVCMILYSYAKLNEVIEFDILVYYYHFFVGSAL